MIDPQLEYAKSSVDTYELPCGYLDADSNLHTSVSVREMTGEEEEILAAKNMPGNKKINKILANCTSAIGEVSGAQVEHVIPDLTQGDRIYLLIAIRRASLGDDMPFLTKCVACEQEARFVLDLADLEAIKMPDPKIRNYVVTLPKTGKKVAMKVLTGRGEDAIGKASSRGRDLITTAIFARVDSIDDQPATMKDLKSLPIIDRNFLRNEWEEHEGGVDTEIKIDCPGCGVEYDTELDISQQGFFNPSATLKSWKKKYSF